MSDLLERVQRSRHLSIQLYKEVHDIFLEIKKEVKAGQVETIVSPELIKSLMMMVSVLDGTCLDIQDLYFALGTVGVRKHGTGFIIGVQNEILSKKSLEEFLACECAECSADSKATVDDVLKQTQDIINKALKESKDK